MTVKKHAMDIAPGKSFVWQNDVYVVAPTEEKSDDEPLIHIFVIRVASLHVAQDQRLEHDTWIATNTEQVERFNPYAQVYPVTWKKVVEVTFERSITYGQEGKAEEKKDEPKT